MFVNSGQQPANPASIMKEAMRQMSVQGSPQPLHTGEHPLLKTSDGSQDSHTSVDGTDPPATTKAVSLARQVWMNVSVGQGPACITQCTILTGFHAGFFAGWGKLFGAAHVKQVVREAHPTRGVLGHPPQKYLKNDCPEIQSGGFLAAKLTAPKFPSLAFKTTARFDTITFKILGGGGGEIPGRPPRCMKPWLWWECAAKHRCTACLCKC